MNRLNIGNKVNSSRFLKGKTDTSSFLTAEDWNAAIKAINDCIEIINNLPEHQPQQESSTNNKIDQLESNLQGLNTRLVGVEESLNDLRPIQTEDGEISIAENDPIFTAWKNGAFKDFFKFNGSNPESISSLNFGNGFVVNTTASTTTVSVDPSIIPSGSGANSADIATLSNKIETLTNNVNALTEDVNTLSNSVNTLSGRVSALETATPSTDNTQQGGETPSTGGDSGTQSGGGDNTGGSDTPTGGGDEPSTGGDDNQGGSGQSSQLQPDTTNGYWVQKSIDGQSQEVIDFLEYDVFDYDTQRIFFICPENSSLQDVSLSSTYSVTTSSTTQQYNAADYIQFNTTTGELTPVDHILSPTPDADANGHAVIPIRATLPGKQPKTLNIYPRKQHQLTFKWNSASGTITDDGGVITSNIPTLSCTGDPSKAALRYRIENASPANCVSLINNNGQPVTDFTQNISSQTVPQPQIVVNSTGSATIIANFGPTNVYSIPQGERSFTLTTTKISYGHWEYTQDINADTPVWTTATELEYYAADSEDYRLRFALENSDAQVTYYVQLPGDGANANNFSTNNMVGMSTLISNYMTYDSVSDQFTVPSKLKNNGSYGNEKQDEFIVYARIKIGDNYVGAVSFTLRAKTKLVQFRFSSSTGSVSGGTVSTDKEIEMPSIQIQRGADAEWINIEDDDSDYFKGNIYISRPVTDTDDVIRLNNEAINNTNTSYRVTIPYNDAKNLHFWSNLIEVVSSGECVLSMNWGPYDQYTFATTQSVTVTSEYSGNATTPPGNDDMY